MNQIGALIGIGAVRRVEALTFPIQAAESVGSMVVYEDGKPKRSDYRKFKIRTVQGPNDYASMEEVLTRRFSMEWRRQRTSERRERNFLWKLYPFSGSDHDGRRKRTRSILPFGVLEQMGLSIPVCGMVKDDFHRTRGLYFNNKEVPIDRHSEGFRLITRIQDGSPPVCH